MVFYISSPYGILGVNPVKNMFVLRCYQGLAVDDDGLTLDAADEGHSRLLLN